MYITVLQDRAMCIQGLNTHLLTIYHQSFMLVRDGVQKHMQQRPLQLDPHPHASSNPYTCTDTLLHLLNSTSDILNTDTMPARAAAAPPLQLQVHLYSDLRTDAPDLVISETTVFACEPIWSCTGSDMC